MELGGGKEELKQRALGLWEVRGRGSRSNIARATVGRDSTEYPQHR